MYPCWSVNRLVHAICTRLSSRKTKANSPAQFDSTSVSPGMEKPEVRVLAWSSPSFVVNSNPPPWSLSALSGIPTKPSTASPSERVSPVFEPAENSSTTTLNRNSECWRSTPLPSKRTLCLTIPMESCV